MNDIPPYHDYVKHSKGKYISSGGGYYSIVPDSKRKILLAVYIALFITVFGLLSWLLFSNIIWFAWTCEFLFAFRLLNIMQSRLEYRYTRFAVVPEGSDAYREASELQYPSHNKALAVIFLFLELLVYVPCSFTVSYIHSIVDHSGGIVDVSFENAEDKTLYSNENATDENTLVSVPDLSDQSLDVWIWVTQTPATARLSLDGQPLPKMDQPQKGTSFVFGEYYFNQSTKFIISASQLHDGSTLTLTCGDLRREWTFDVADSKEGL